MEAWEKKVNNRLDNIWPFWAARDYVRANYKGKRKYKRRHPYCLSERAMAARETRLNGSESQKKAMVLGFFREFPQIDIDAKSHETKYCTYWINNR